MKQVKVRKTKNKFEASLVKVFGNRDGRQLMMVVKRGATGFSSDEISPSNLLSHVKPEKRS